MKCAPRPARRKEAPRASHPLRLLLPLHGEAPRAPHPVPPRRPRHGEAPRACARAAAGAQFEVRVSLPEDARLLLGLSATAYFLED